MDLRNTFPYHLVVASVSVLLVAALYFSGINLGRSVAGTAFILLFLTLIIGPAMRLWRPALEALPWNLPWSWRGELGIWFVIASIAHVLLVFSGREWDVAGYMAGMRISDLIGFVALFIALVLAATSFGRAVKFLGLQSWRWLQSFAYVVFYLVGAHTLNHAFFRPGRPEDWLHWAYLAMIIIVILLQSLAFIKTVTHYRRTLKPEDYVPKE
jgi:methionine sulfoxide reductase heme-binding subunit